jgi:hypothetical protein
MARKFNRPKWRPARKGEPGHKARRFYPKSVKIATDETPSLSYRQVSQKSQGNVTLEVLAKRRSRVRVLFDHVQAKFEVFQDRRKVTAGLKRKYAGEPIKAIREFEKGKKYYEDGRQGDQPFDKEEYDKFRKFLEKYKGQEEDLWKLVKDISPSKKRRRGGRESERRTIERAAWKREVRREFKMKKAA